MSDCKNERWDEKAADSIRDIFFYRKEVTKTTIWLKVVVVLVVAGIAGFLYSVRATLLPHVAGALIHRQEPMPSDALVIENYDNDYLAFEKAADLLREGYAARVFVPVTSFRDPSRPWTVAKGFADVMCGAARIQSSEILPVQHLEPITLNVARQVAAALKAEGIRSAIIVVPQFRSRRTYLTYRAVLAPLGISFCCTPSRSVRNIDNWWMTAHGIQEIMLELVKLGYYRFYILRG